MVRRTLARAWHRAGGARSRTATSPRSETGERGGQGSVRRDREELLRLLPRGGVVAEVGVWKGDFSAQLLATLDPAELHLVDPWAFRPDYEHALYGGNAAKSQDDMDAIYEGVRARFAGQIEQRRVELHRNDSAIAAAGFAPSTFDAVYIDGDHTYDAVVADLRAWAPLVKPLGVLAGDDYSATGWWQDGVKRAVDEFAHSTDWELTVIGSQFAFRPRS
jgi:hypothetical protein